MTPIKFLLENEAIVRAAFDGSSKKAWSILLIQLPEITNVMALNSFRVLIRPFVETCRFFDDRLNKLNTHEGLNKLNEGEAQKLNTHIEELNKTINGLNTELNNDHELNIKLNTQIEELNIRLNTLDGLNTELNNELVKCRLNIPDSEQLNNSGERLNMKTEQVKQKLNIAGWTVAKSGGYFRAFKKIKGRVYGVHLGRDLVNAEAKIEAKRLQMQGAGAGR